MDLHQRVAGEMVVVHNPRLILNASDRRWKSERQSAGPTKNLMHDLNGIIMRLELCSEYVFYKRV